MEKNGGKGGGAGKICNNKNGLFLLHQKSFLGEGHARPDIPLSRHISNVITCKIYICRKLTGMADKTRHISSGYIVT